MTAKEKPLNEQRKFYEGRTVKEDIGKY
jgi:hypothetical protein